MRLDSLIGKLVVSSLAVVAIACAPPRSYAPGGVDTQIITEEEIDASRAATAYEAIQKLRANFLSYRGETSLNRNQSQPFPTVYVDGGGGRLHRYARASRGVTSGSTVWEAQEVRHRQQGG